MPRKYSAIKSEFGFSSLQQRIIFLRVLIFSRVNAYHCLDVEASLCSPMDELDIAETNGEPESVDDRCPDESVDDECTDELVVKTHPDNKFMEELRKGDLREVFY